MYIYLHQADDTLDLFLYVYYISTEYLKRYQRLVLRSFREIRFPFVSDNRPFRHEDNPWGCHPFFFSTPQRRDVDVGGRGAWAGNEPRGQNAR